MAEQFFMTKKGKEELEAKLKFLQGTKRDEVVARLAEARSHGDLSENAEYDAAKDELASLDGEIEELGYKIKNAVIIEDNNDASYVHIGTVVKVYDYMYEEECEYEIMGSTEAKPAEGKISNESPIGVALMGHRKGDKVEVSAPDGVYTLEILDITVR